MNYGRCKFDPCAYKHITNENTIENFTTKNQIIMEKVDNLEKLVESKEEVINCLRDSISNLQKDIREKDIKIDNFEERLNKVEAKNAKELQILRKL